LQFSDPAMPHATGDKAVVNAKNPVSTIQIYPARKYHGGINMTIVIRRIFLFDFFELSFNENFSNNAVINAMLLQIYLIVHIFTVA
jgi:hypothetical protein